MLITISALRWFSFKSCNAKGKIAQRLEGSNDSRKVDVPATPTTKCANSHCERDTIVCCAQVIANGCVAMADGRQLALLGQYLHACRRLGQANSATAALEYGRKYGGFNSYIYSSAVAL